MNAVSTSTSASQTSPGRSQVQRSENSAPASRAPQRREAPNRPNSDRVRVSTEASRPQAAGSTPNFGAAFGPPPAPPANAQAPAAANGGESSGSTQVLQGLNQGRVLAGQVPTALGVSPNPGVRAGTGLVGGAAAAGLAADQLSRGEFGAAAGNALHATHGLVGQFGRLPTPPSGALGPGLAGVATAAGRAAPLIGGGVQALSALDSQRSTPDRVLDGLSGGAKILGAGLAGTGVAIPAGAALIAGSTAVDALRLVGGAISNAQITPSEMSPLGVTSPDGSPLGA